MKCFWFSEKRPQHGQLINWTFNGTSRDRDSDQPFAGPYSSFGRYNALLDIVVSSTMEVWEVTAVFAWHPVAPGYVFTHATLAPSA